MTQVRIDSLLRCPYCHDAIVGPGRKTGCESCFAWHHSACIQELGCCGNCGAEAPSAPKQPSLAVERARLNALLATSCVHQSCSSLETIAVDNDFVCRRHLKQQAEILLAVGVSMTFGALIPLWGLVKGAGFPALLFALFFVALGGVLVARRNKLKTLLAEAEAERPARSEAAAPAAPARGSRRRVSKKHSA